MSLSASPPSPEAPPVRRAPVPLVLFAVLGLVLVFFFGWHQDWFGRELPDEKILELLQPDGDPRGLQHALAQLEGRLGPRYAGRERFRAPVVALTSHPAWEIRRQVAWVMGREPAEEYVIALRAMLQDADAGVRRNAACALSNTNDPLARPVLLEALRPVTVPAAIAGKLDLKVKVGESVSHGRDAGTILGPAGESAPVRSPFPGMVREVPAGNGTEVAAGAAILVVAPDPSSVLNAIVALGAVGLREDIPALQEFAEGRVAGMSPEVAPEARKTLALLERR